jgi:ABC-2 type transport system ATP-binding protein
MNAPIETEGLTKAYVKRRSLREVALRPFRAAERVVALQDVTLEVRSGEIFGLLGPNGAGKTTLLKILAGLVLPSGGRARIAGADVARDDRAVKRSIGFVTSDERSFYWRLTGRENLHFFAALCGLDFASGRSRAAALLQSMELTSVADQQFLGYSSGMKQRLAIARALLHDPPILCLDEPTRSLDPIAAKHLRRFVMDRLNREGGKTVLLATHNLQEAEEMCGRLLVLDRGRAVRIGSVAEITAGLPGQEQYVLQVVSVQELPRDSRWTLRVERREDGRMHLHAAIDRGGTALSDLLRGLLHEGGTILSCARREPSLQEVFDQLEPSPGRPEAAGRRGERP